MSDALKYGRQQQKQSQKRIKKIEIEEKLEAIK